MLDTKNVYQLTEDLLRQTDVKPDYDYRGAALQKIRQSEPFIISNQSKDGWEYWEESQFLLLDNLHPPITRYIF